MTRSRLGPASAVLLCLAASACANGNRFKATGSPTPLPAAPSGPVQITQLPPPGGGPDPQQMPGATGLSSGDVARESLLGTWRISSAGSSCSLNLTLTGWTGGYRASTRGCMAPELQGINAWAFEGGQVILKDGSGSPIVQLAAQSGSSMAGATAAGAPVAAIR